jgi:hypothetical protein
VLLRCRHRVIPRSLRSRFVVRVVVIAGWMPPRFTYGRLSVSSVRSHATTTNSSMVITQDVTHRPLLSVALMRALRRRLLLDLPLLSRSSAKK